MNISKRSERILSDGDLLRVMSASRSAETSINKVRFLNCVEPSPGRLEDMRRELAEALEFALTASDRIGSLVAQLNELIDSLSNRAYNEDEDNTP